MKKLLLLGLPLLAACARSAPEPAPALPIAQGVVVRHQFTTDARNQLPRLRWVVALDAPLTFPGLNGQSYAQVKVFGLPDTIGYRAGTRLRFRYQPVALAQQTPWLTPYERYAVPAGWPGYVANPELVLSDVEPL